MSEQTAAERALDEIHRALPAWASDTEDVPLSACVQGCISTLTRDLAAAEARATAAEQGRDEAKRLYTRYFEEARDQLQARAAAEQREAELRRLLDIAGYR